MTWNGSGTYSLPAASFPEAPGNIVDSARYNATFNDVALGLNNAVAKDGQNAATANLPMGGFKHTGAAAAAASGEYIVWSQNATLGNLTYTGVLTGGIGIINIGSGQVYKDASGNVGINNAAPVNTLTVNGTIGFNLNGAADAFKFFSGGAGLVYAGTTTATAIGLISGGTERVRIDTSGNVGIGTTAPTRPLDVNGAMRLRGLASAPASPNEGDVYYDSTTKKHYGYNGTAWQAFY